MANHHKPSKAELEAGMKKSLEDLSKLPPDDQTPPTPPAGDPPAGDPPAGDPPTPPTPPTPPGDNPPTPPTPPEIKIDDVRGKKAEDLTEDEKKFAKEHASEFTPEEQADLGVTPQATPPATDWEKKFKESSREAQVMGFKNKELNKAIEDAAALPAPTDEEMKGIYSKWDELDEFQKSIARDNELNKRKFNLITSATSKFKEVDAWNEKVDQFVGNPQTLIDHPELEGKEDEFKNFASKPSRRGLDMEDLLLAFRGDLAAHPKPTHQGQEMFPTGGSRAPTPTKPVDDRLSPAEGEALRKTDYKKYVQLLKAGKIRNE